MIPDEFVQVDESIPQPAQRQDVCRLMVISNETNKVDFIDWIPHKVGFCQLQMGKKVSSTYGPIARVSH